MEALKLEGISKNFGGIQVLLDLSFSVKEGEYLAIIGPNGAGKTTLFNLISGELPATEGAIYFFGKEITTMSPHQRVHLGIGRSFQITHLLPELSVLDNMLLALHGTRKSRYQMLRSHMSYSELMEKAQKFLEFIALWERKDFPVKAISYGEQRKIEIALTLALEPKMLLLDEPSAGLAINEVPPFIEMIKDLVKGRTLLFTAHDMDVVFGLANRLVVLYFGQIIAHGTPEEIEANPKVKEIYLGLEVKEENAQAG